MSETNDERLGHGPVVRSTRKTGTIRWLTRLSFSICLLFLAAGITALCWCPDLYLAAAGASLFPIVFGPKRMHRLAAVFLLLIALIYADEAAKRQAGDDAAVARIRAMAQHPAATTTSATEP